MRGIPSKARGTNVARQSSVPAYDNNCDTTCGGISSDATRRVSAALSNRTLRKGQYRFTAHAMPGHLPLSAKAKHSFKVHAYLSEILAQKMTETNHPRSGYDKFGASFRFPARAKMEHVRQGLPEFWRARLKGSFVQHWQPVWDQSLWRKV